MAYQVRMLLESEAMIKGEYELGNLMVNPFYGRTIDDIKENLDYAKEVYGYVYEWFIPTLLSQGKDIESLKEFKIE